jgi:hypothetical protein
MGFHVYKLDARGFRYIRILHEVFEKGRDEFGFTFQFGLFLLEIEAEFGMIGLEYLVIGFVELFSNFFFKPGEIEFVCPERGLMIISL